MEAIHKNDPSKDTMIGVPPTSHNLKAKLDGLRKIFDEDDTAHLRMQQGHFQNVPTLAN